MNDSAALAKIPLGHKVRLQPKASLVQSPSSLKRWALSFVCLAGLALLVSSCATPSFSRSSAIASHSCADKVAQAAVQGSVPGLWNCLDVKFQQSLGGTGSDNSLVSRPFATDYRYIGSSADAAYYEISLTAQAAQQNGFHELALVVWVDVDGRVASFDVGASPA